MNNILYHPNIEFKDEDYNWLIRASLFWDNIYRIVPSGYTPEDNENIRILSEEGGFIRKISVNKYGSNMYDLRYTASMEFYRDYENIINNYYKENPNWIENTTIINIAKADYALFETLDQLGLVFKPESKSLWSNEWVLIPKFIGDRYMSYFARHIANKNNMSLATPDSESWLAASNLPNCSQGINAFAFPVSINDIIPANLDIPPEKLIKFREKRKDERIRLNEQFERFSKKISQVESLEIFKHIWNDECREIELAIADYKKSMDIIHVSKFLGSLSFIGSIIGFALKTAGLPVGSLITGSVCLGLKFGKAIAKSFMPNNKNAYSYLYDIHGLAPKNFRKQPILPKRI